MSTSLGLVNAAPSQPAPLLAENQDSEVDPKGCHVCVASRREGTCSAKNYHKTTIKEALW
ncbi:MAG: hypothetical protein RM021_029080 [Nostoc sp. EkiNYC01]|nr:hypothetical protein [Nostoc sp. EkiNYC01]